VTLEKDESGDYEFLRVTGLMQAWVEDDAWARFEITIYLPDGETFGPVDAVLRDRRKALRAVD
jgi:hypothetical protein